MLSSLAILGMSGQDLNEHLTEKAASNPCLSYVPPAQYVTSGAEFDAAAALASDRPSLMSHVVGQIELAFDTAEDRLLALRIAEALEPSGWLGQPLGAIAAMAGVAEPRADAVLGVLQGFEPAGLFARSLAECLLIQARDADSLTWEMQALIENLDLVVEGRTSELAELCDCEVEDIPELLRDLRQFDPKPGLAFAHSPTPIFPPDLVATRDGVGWQVDLNRGTTPTVTVRPDRLPDGTGDAEARAFRRKALAEAQALARAVAQRSSTLQRTGAVLVARQTAFLDRGPGHLVPLSLEDVAGELGLHPSTISRATSGRMIQTPAGTFPMRSFFSRALSAASGEAVSRDAAQRFVADAVAAEDPQAPLSDDAIVAQANAAEIPISRRTVAKYRAQLGIASSYRRRRTAASA